MIVQPNHLRLDEMESVRLKHSSTSYYLYLQMQSGEFIKNIWILLFNSEMCQVVVDGCALWQV